MFLRSAAKKNRMKKLLSLFILAQCLLACVDEIDLGQAEDLPEGIVVRGSLVLEEQATVEVVLEELFQFESNLPDRVVTADVTLENSEGQQLDLPYREGAYRASIDPAGPDFLVRPGLGYRIMITTLGGQRYGSSFDVMQERVPLDGVGNRPAVILQENAIGDEVEVPGLAYEVTTPVRYASGAPAYLRYTFQRVYALTTDNDAFPLDPDRIRVCYISETAAPNTVTILSGSALSADRVEDFPLVVEPINYKYAQGHVLNVYQDAISQDAYLYFDQISRISDRDQSIFTNPPGPIVGNVEDLDGNTRNVFGYFYSANRFTERVGTTPAEVGNPRTRCPPPPTNGPGGSPLVCLDCTNAEGSSLTRPDYWPY